MPGCPLRFATSPCVSHSRLHHHRTPLKQGGNTALRWACVGTKMESQSDTGKGKQRNQPAAPVQQDFLFVDASKSAKSSRQGRRNARSFVMQKARRERPWSTSKHAAKQRRSPETVSPATIGTPDLSHTPITSTPSPPGATNGVEYFPYTVPNNYPVVKQEICSDCQIFLCRPGQSLCPRCLQLQPPVPIEDPDTSLFDPFGTASVPVDRGVTELLEHCKFSCPWEANPSPRLQRRLVPSILVGSRPTVLQDSCIPPGDLPAAFTLVPVTILGSKAGTDVALQLLTKWRLARLQSTSGISPT